MYGGWAMKYEDINGLTPQEIQEKFALPHTPKYIADVTFEKGDILRTGEVNPLFGGNEVNVASRNMTGKAANNSTSPLANKGMMIAENGTLG